MSPRRRPARAFGLGLQHRPPRGRRHASRTGDLVLCDVARRDVSLLVADLRELDVDVDGSIAIEEVDAEISGLTSNAFRRRRDDFGSDPVVWENVSSRTSENVELSHSYLIFMTAAMLIASVGIYFNQPILIVGAMVVGPDFGPIAGICVAVVNRSRVLVRRSATALFVGFLVGTIVTYLATLLLKAIGQIPESIDFDSHSLVRFISNPDFFSVYVALAAGVVGMLSLTTAKSSALVGVLISVATVPAASNIGVAAAYTDWATAWGATVQLAPEPHLDLRRRADHPDPPAPDLHEATPPAPERHRSPPGRPADRQEPPRHRRP